jgi:hypothetical protein
MQASDCLAVVHVGYSRPEAEVICSKLRAYGIPAQIKADTFATLHPYLLVAMGGLAVAVPSAAADDGLAIVAAAPEGATLWESAAFVRRPFTNIIVFFTIFWFCGFVYCPFWLRDGRYRT